jgi:hypothetical protein
MLNDTSKEYRELFLLKFTEQLILHSKNIEIFKLEELLRQREKIKDVDEIKEEVREKLHPKVSEKNVSISEDPFFKKEEKRILRPKFIRKETPSPSPRKILRLPKPTQLPPQFSYLQPIPTDKSIELGKLNILIQDRNVQSIECEGDDTKIFVIGTMGKKPTSIVLSKEEINAVIDKFSQESKIPKTIGIFKVVVGKLMLTAMISESVGTRFIIKKIEEKPAMGQVPQRRF